MGLMVGKSVIVTGCGSEIGMGWATAVKCAQEGANVLVTDLRTDNLGKLVEELQGYGVKAVSAGANIANREEVNAVVEKAVAEFGAIHGMVNNAGTADQNSTLLECTDEMLEFNMGINFKGPLYFCQAVIPHMIEQGGGAIVNNVSVNATRPLPNWMPYVTSKNALIGLTKVVAVDHGADNIRCNAICPGAIRTELALEGVRHAIENWGLTAEQVEDGAVSASTLMRWGAPSEAADLMTFLISDMSSFVTGSVIEVGGGVVRGLS